MLHDLNTQLQTLLPGASLQKATLPGCKGLQLYLIDQRYRNTGLDTDTASKVMDNPLYWLFCWASGLVLARRLLEQPSLVAGKTVLDIGSGSGVVAIAAAMAGAATVIASDTDEQAQQAIRINAGLNNVTLQVLGDYRQWRGAVDLITVADVLYERNNLPLLDQLVQNAPLLLADARIRNFSHPGLVWCESVPGYTFPSLGGFDEFSTVNIYQSLV